MKRTVDLNVAGGTILIGPWGTFPGAILKLEDATRTQQILMRIARDRSAMEQLRREWNRLGLMVQPQANSAVLIATLQRETTRRHLSLLFLPHDDDGLPPAQPAPRPARPPRVSEWTPSEKIQAALTRSGSRLSGELRRMIEELLSPVNVAVTIGLIVALAASHAAGVGVIADAVLVGFAYAAAGLAGIKAIGDFISATVKAMNATSEREIDEAAAEYAAAFVILGTAFLARFLGKAKSRPRGKVDRQAPPTRPQQRPAERRREPTPAARSAKQADVDARVSKMPPAWQREHEAAKAAGWKKPNGDPWYPPNDGAIGTPQRVTIGKGAQMDRYGHEGGSFLSKAGESFESRALNRSPTEAFNTYTVNKPMIVEQAKIAPWFGQPGGGTQYKLIDPVTGNTMSVATAKLRGFLSGGPGS